ncbi:MAG: YybS family protein [Treponema sp.]|jgi:hypothetical protein|nr:YybS family protein [Treponema sp.]
MDSPELPPPVPDALTRGNSYAAALVCAFISVILMQSGFLSFLFLIPLGYIAAAYNIHAARRAFAGAIGLNILLSLGLSFFLKSSFFLRFLDILYYTVMSLAFFWIMAPPERGLPLLRIRTAYRLIGGALAGSLVFLFIMYTSLNNTGFSALVRSQTEALSSLYIASSGADAARRSFLEQQINPDRVLELLKLGALRGGAVASCLILFFFSRQAARSLARIIRHVSPSGQASGGLRGFHVPPPSIWVLSLSLAVILGSRIFGITVLETVSWNVLIISVMLFLAQGGGIALYVLSRRAVPPMIRLFLNILLIVLIFSPGINALLLGVLVLLGIAENWVPFRAPKPDGSSSTPGI